MELDARKAKLVREILTEVNSIELLEKISKYLHKHLQQTMNRPCQFTVEELEQVLEQSQEDIKKGNISTHEDMVKEVFQQISLIHENYLNSYSQNSSLRNSFIRETSIRSGCCLQIGKKDGKK